MLRKVRKEYIAIIILVLLIVITGISFCDCIRNEWIPSNPNSFTDHESVVYMNLQNEAVLLITVVQILACFVSGRLFRIVGFAGAIVHALMNWRDCLRIIIQTSFGGLGYNDCSFTVWGWLIHILNLMVIILTFWLLIMDIKDEK